MQTQHYLPFLVSFMMLQFLSLSKWVFIQTSIIHENIASKVGEKRRQGVGQRMNSSMTHDNICLVIDEKYHPKS